MMAPTISKITYAILVTVEQQDRLKLHAVGRAIAYIILTILAIASFLSVYGIPLGFLFIWGIYKIRKNSQITDIQHRLKDFDKITRRYMSEQRQRIEQNDKDKLISHWKYYLDRDKDSDRYR